MQARFQGMSENILARIDEMGGRLDDLEKSISDLVQQAGVDAGGDQHSQPQQAQQQEERIAARVRAAFRASTISQHAHSFEEDEALLFSRLQRWPCANGSQCVGLLSALLTFSFSRCYMAMSAAPFLLSVSRGNQTRRSG
eukprot:TRINITY_DN6718_c0_g1_i1.p1 TRINITY_DN6718_c0_g1~~TRINITY_DN6718_c0_g1_i1.p1  ORF type:complete len:140 (+),score=18.08 TRINITY_DN6718_c0_g1_i1:274-693(+)